MRLLVVVWSGLEFEAEQAPFYRTIYNVVTSGCRAAINVAKYV